MTEIIVDVEPQFNYTNLCTLRFSNAAQKGDLKTWLLSALQH